jgi:hypothetical protein
LSESEHKESTAVHSSQPDRRLLAACSPTAPTPESMPFFTGLPSRVPRRPGRPEKAIEEPLLLTVARIPFVHGSRAATSSPPADARWRPRTRGLRSPAQCLAIPSRDSGGRCRCRLRSSAPTKKAPADGDPSGCRPPALPHPQQRSRFYQGCREAYLLSAVRCALLDRVVAHLPFFICSAASVPRVLESEKLLCGLGGVRVQRRLTRVPFAESAWEGKAARERKEGPARGGAKASTRRNLPERGRTF